MDHTVSGLPGEKIESQQLSGEPSKTSASSSLQQTAPVSETQSSAASSPQGLHSLILSDPFIETVKVMQLQFYINKHVT
jgi:hypothetical protein